MSERVEDRKLESVVTLGCGSPDKPQLVAGRCESTPEARPAWRRRRNTITRLGPKRSRIAKPSRKRRLEHNNVSAEKILAACEMILSTKTNAHVQSLPREEEILAACEMILSTKARTHDQGLPQEPTTTASLESDSLINRQTHSKAKEVNFGNTLEDNEDSFPREEPAVRTDSAERQRPRQNWSVRIVLPRRTGLHLEAIGHCLAEVWNWTRKQLSSCQTKKRLRVCETVSLGEKRFVSVIEVDGEQFLVGGASSSVATLARLEPSPEFSEVLKRRWSQELGQA